MPQLILSVPSCADRWNSDLARLPVLDGAQLLLIPSFGSCAPEQDEAVVARARENGVAIVEANVGVLLWVSRGEIVGREARLEAQVGKDEHGNSLPGATSGGSNLAIQDVTFHAAFEIEIPAPANSANHAAWTEKWLEWQGPAMEERWRNKVLDTPFPFENGSLYPISGSKL